jgi:hypothetical protein
LQAFETFAASIGANLTTRLRKSPNASAAPRVESGVTAYAARQPAMNSLVTVVARTGDMCAPGAFAHTANGTDQCAFFHVDDGDLIAAA